MTTPTLTDMRAEVYDAIRASIENHPRSQQKRIGPSELGTPCDHCLAAKLAGWEKNDTHGWLPFIGTAVHAELDTIFTLANRDHYRWATEQTVTVGTIGGVEITGSCDLYDHDTGTVIDHKVVGKTTLDQARRSGASPTYRVQAHLYGLGWANRGETVTQVAINYLPRNAVSLEHGVWWTEPWDRDIAEAALARANRLHTNLTVLSTISTEARDAWITGLPRDPHCRDCQKFPDRPIQVPAPDSLDRLLG